MENNTYSHKKAELIAKNIILSNGGNLRLRNSNLTLSLRLESGEHMKKEVSSLYFLPGNEICVFFEATSRPARFENNKEKKKVFRYIMENFPMPETAKDEQLLQEHLQLRERNMEFIALHGDLRESDFEMIRATQEAVKKAHEAISENPVPLPGDIIEGAYYDGKFPFKNGVLESIPGFKKPLNVCAQPYTPFIYLRDETPGYYIHTSGGPFFSFSPEDLELVGKDTREVCDWGHNGPCASGTVHFPVEVNRWRIKETVKY